MEDGFFTVDYETLLPIFQNHRLLKNGFYHRFFRYTALFACENPQISLLINQPIVFLNM